MLNSFQKHLEIGMKYVRVCESHKSFQTNYLGFNKTINSILKIRKAEIFYSLYSFAILILELGKSHVYVFLVLRLLDHHLYGSKTVWVLLKKSNTTIKILKFIWMKLLENITSYVLLSSKVGQMAFGPTIYCVKNSVINLS